MPTRYLPASRLNSNWINGHLQEPSAPVVELNLGGTAQRVQTIFATTRKAKNGVIIVECQMNESKPKKYVTTNHGMSDLGLLEELKKEEKRLEL